MLMGQRRTSLLQPALEGVGARQIESLKKRTPIAFHRAFQRPCSYRSLELTKISADQLGVESEILIAQQGVLSAEVAPEGIQRLGQRAAAPFLISVRPQVGEKRISRRALIPSHSQNRKQGKPARLGRGSA